MNSGHRTYTNKMNTLNDGIAVKLTLRSLINKGFNILEITLNESLLYSNVTLVNTNNIKMNGVVLENNYIYFQAITDYCEPGSIIYIHKSKSLPNYIFQTKKRFVNELYQSIEITRKLTISSVNIIIALDLNYDKYISDSSASDEFEDLFISSLSETLGINRDRIVINSIKPGSVLVSFSILEPTNINEMKSISVVEELKYQLSLPKSIIRQNYIFNTTKSLEVIIKPDNNNTSMLLENYHIRIYQKVFNNDNNDLFTHVILKL